MAVVEHGDAFVAVIERGDVFVAVVEHGDNERQRLLATTQSSKPHSSPAVSK